MARPLSVSLQEYVVDWKLLPWPIPWAEVFGRPAPLVLEIGFGNGTFLTELGARRPERDHVGIELSWTAATHLFRRLQQAELSNVRALLGNAEELVRHNFRAGQLDEVFVNHPCPWPKSRHAERRLLSRAFLGLLAERMRPGAKLTVVTDHADYARWLGVELEAQSALVSCHATAEVASLPDRTPTKYQLKAMAQGLPIHYFEWRKADGAADAPVAAERAAEISMPTLTLAGAVEPAELFHGFAPQLFRERHREVEVVVKLIAVYQRPDAPVWLLECFVLEDRLQQQFALDVVLRGATVLLKPSALGQPYPTHGVKRAVWCAARWLQSRHPTLVMQYESLGLRPPAEPWP